MTSLRQYEANRQNAQRSTGPRSDQGKLHSRRNAVRHGLTAETVIEILEDPEDYKDFEANIIADYDARTAVQRELVLRLASLLWRIRRATGIETDLLRIQAETLRERVETAPRDPEPETLPANPLNRAPRAVIPHRWGRDQPGSIADRQPSEDSHERDVFARPDGGPEGSIEPMRTLTYCFLRVGNLDNGVFKRLNRYEAALWRQTVQTMTALRSIRFR